MRRSLALALFFFLAAFAARAGQTHGAWRLTLTDSGKLQMDLVQDHNRNSHPIERTELTGLSAAQVEAGTDTPVDFRLVRDAGSLHFTGTFVRGDGVGRFTFEPNAAYAATLRTLGVTPHELDDETLFSLALHDVSASFIKEMQALGYHEDLDQYVAFRIHGATPQFARELVSLGYKTDGDQLVAFRIHGVSVPFIQGMKELGVGELDADNLVALRIHGASVEYVRELRDLGYQNVSAEDLVAMRIHGVSPSYIRDLRSAGYTNIPVEKLVEMKIHGIDAEFVKRTK
jgi:hypothetical protein